MTDFCHTRLLEILRLAYKYNVKMTDLCHTRLLERLNLVYKHIFQDFYQTLPEILSLSNKHKCQDDRFLSLIEILNLVYKHKYQDFYHTIPEI